MATINSFEDFEAWQKARRLSQQVYRLTLNEPFEKDYSLKDQINASTGSIMDNIAEGFERGGNREFINFLFIAKGSSGETRSQLYRAIDRGHISAEVFTELKAEAISISRIISGLISYLQGSGIRGSKFRGR